MVKPKIRFLGRHLMMKGTYVEKLLRSEKKATIRKGIFKPKYDEVIIHAGGKPVAKAKIKRVYYKKLKELGEYEAQIEGYTDVDGLISELKRVYGHVHDDDYFTIIELEVTQRLDELVAGDPYCGLKPADIARIALRYLDTELTELEKRVLLSLTRTNSIRKTAVVVFKDINKRGTVRRILKKALQTLVERRLLRIRATPSTGALGEGERSTWGTGYSSVENAEESGYS
ncbi:MAG: ASCH domain-containing protein [Desulfurococcaceae archaeon]